MKDTNPTQKAYVSHEVRIACWDALSETAGSKMIEAFDPELAKIYRADEYGYVVTLDEPLEGPFRFEVDHDYPQSK